MALLNKIIEPLNIQDFISKYWTKAFLRVEGERGKFANILDLETFRKVFEAYSDYLSFPQVTLTRDGSYLDETKYSKKWRLRISAILGYKENTSIDLSKINSILIDGITLKVSQFENIYPGLVDLLNEFCDDLPIETIYVNALYSTPSTHGFNAHFDEHDVFVLQLHGEKTWELFDAVQDNPLQEYRGTYSVDKATGSGKKNITVRQGDLLYIPRGMWHNVYTEKHPSLHLQIGVRPKTVIDLVRFIENKMLESSDFRHTLPSGNALTVETKQLIVDRLKECLEDDEIIQSFFKNDHRKKDRSGLKIY